MSNKQIRYRNILEKSPIKYLCPICGSYHDVPEMMPLKKWKMKSSARIFQKFLQNMR